MIDLAETEVIETAWAEEASGPGWNNTLINVLIYDRRTGHRRVTAIQPEEQPVVLAPMMRVFVATNQALLAAVRTLVPRRPG